MARAGDFPAMCSATDIEQGNGAHQNLKVMPQRVSLLTFKAFMTPCACMHNGIRLTMQ